MNFNVIAVISIVIITIVITIFIVTNKAYLKGYRDGLRLIAIRMKKMMNEYEDTDSIKVKYIRQIFDELVAKGANIDIIDAMMGEE